MEYKFFKADANIEQIKKVYNDWEKNKEKRNKELDEISRTIPFFDGWYGNYQIIMGVICNEDNPLLSDIEKEKCYTLSKIENKNYYVVKANKRYKKGRDFDEKINKASGVMWEYPEFSDYVVRKMKINCMVHDFKNAYVSVCGIIDDTFIARIPIKENGAGGDSFPKIPDFLTEIKESEFLAIQGL